MSTPCRTWTGPKPLRMSRSSIRGSISLLLGPATRGVRPGCSWSAPPGVAASSVESADAGLLAGCGGRTLADVGHLGVAVVEDLLHVVRGHHDRVLREERRSVG